MQLLRAESDLLEAQNKEEVGKEQASRFYLRRTVNRENIFVESLKKVKDPEIK